MALIKCPECKKEISNSAKNCPSCGYKISKSGIGCFTYLLIGLGILIFFYIIGGKCFNTEITMHILIIPTVGICQPCPIEIIACRIIT